MALRRSLARLGGGDKSSFAAKRRVIHPITTGPTVSRDILKYAFTTDAMKENRDVQVYSGGEMMREALQTPARLEGERSRALIAAQNDPDFESLIDFVRGARHDDMITGRRFQKLYESLTVNDDLIMWLCMTAMAVLNPGDVRSRLIYRHLEALVQAVAAEEMQPRTAFRFFEAAVRSPAYRELAARQLETGASTRLAGICSAAETMRKMGVTRRPMTAYFELYRRITERSEAMTPWAFPPLFQFEERLALDKRLQFFGRPQAEALRRGSLQNRVNSKFGRLARNRVYWIPPSWKSSKTWVGNNHVRYPGVIAD